MRVSAESWFINQEHRVESNAEFITIEMPYTEEGRKDQSLTDPCYKERQFSLKCMDEKNYDKGACYREFTNFKNCKKFWTNIIKVNFKYNFVKG